jgi:Tol biopolymer transport system component
MSIPGFFRRPAVVLVLGLCTVGLVISALGRLASGPATQPKRIELTSGTGSEACPTFSPDGKRLAYCARGAAANDLFHIYVRALPAGTPQQLTNESDSDIGPAWSPDGRTLVFLRVQEGHARLLAIPAGGGVERQVAAFDIPQEDDSRTVGSLAWTRDSRSLVAVESSGEDQPSFLALIQVADGATRHLTNPPKQSRGDSMPAVSPDGQSVAFYRAKDSESGDIYLCDLSGGNLRPVTFDGRPIRGLTWTPDSKNLVYAASRAHGWALWSIPSYGGSAHDLLIGGRAAGDPAIAPDGKRLVFSQAPSVASIWLAKLGSPNAAKDALPLIHSSGSETRATWSPDGKQVADVSGQTGDSEIWVGDADGGNRRQLTHLKANWIDKPRWSPDGRRILFVAGIDRGPEPFVIPSDGSTGPIHLKLPGGAQSPSWSHDGKAIYYVDDSYIWKAAADGSGQRQITERHWSAEPMESVDGKYVYYRSGRSLWRVPAEGGKEEEIIVPEHDFPWSTTIQPAASGIYYSEFNRSSRALIVMFYDFRTQKTAEVFRLGDTRSSPDAIFSISPDGKSLLFQKIDRSATSLVLVDNYR